VTDDASFTLGRLADALGASRPGGAARAVADELRERWA
jgi:hypothetical protein